MHRDRLQRRIGHRHHAFPAALPDYDGERLWRPDGIARERNQFRRAQPRTIDQFHERAVANGARIATRCPRRRDVQQRDHLGNRSRARKSARRARRIDISRRVIRPDGIHLKKGEESAQGRTLAPKTGGRKIAPGREQPPDILIRRTSKPSAKDIRRTLQVPPIGKKRVARGPALRRDHVEKQRDEARIRRHGLCDSIARAQTIKKGVTTTALFA